MSDGQIAQGGGGATPAGGGAGGDGGPADDATLRGEDGVSGTGGDGGGGVNAVGGGGGGGGGFFGGGGGGAAGDGFGSAAGGGGGVNLTSDITIDENTGVDAENDGNGGVELAYEVGDTSCLAGAVDDREGHRRHRRVRCPARASTSRSAASTRRSTSEPWGSRARPRRSRSRSSPMRPAWPARSARTRSRSSVRPTARSPRRTDGGATGVSYLCSAQIETFDDGPIAEGFGNPSAAAIGPFPDACAAQGAQAGPVLVHIVDPNQSATVTVTNLNDPVAPLVLIAPRFTG